VGPAVMPSSSRKGKPAAPPPASKKGKPAKAPPPARKGGAPPPRPTPTKGPSKSAPSAPPAKGSSKRPAPASAAPAAPVVPELPRRGDARRHVLSLSFLRDGDEFLARLETDAGQITELKNRSLDQLLTLVAGELEDLLE
jgi:hypothetical protein